MIALYNINGMSLFPYVMKSKLIEEVIFDLSDEIKKLNTKNKSKNRSQEIISKMKGK